jgi:hypothetical protein
MQREAGVESARPMNRAAELLDSEVWVATWTTLVEWAPVAVIAYWAAIFRHGHVEAILEKCRPVPQVKNTS